MLTKITPKKEHNRLFLRISKGYIRRGGDLYESVSGSLVKIFIKEHLDKNAPYRNWHLLIDDWQRGEYYDVAMSERSSAFVSLVRRLLSENGMRALHDIVINVRPIRGEFSEVAVSAGGIKLTPSPEACPRISKNGSDTDIDAERAMRMKWLSDAVERINRQVDAESGTEEKEEELDFGRDE